MNSSWINNPWTAVVDRNDRTGIIKHTIRKMSLFVKEDFWTESNQKILISLPLRGKQRKDVDILQTSKYLKVGSIRDIWNDIRNEFLAGHIWAVFLWIGLS